MAKARMLHRSISYDQRFNGMTMSEQWLYMRLLPFADDEGKLTGNLVELKLLCIPASTMEIKRLDEMIQNISKTGLLKYNKDKVIQYSGWKRNQKIGHRPQKSDYPDIDASSTPVFSKGTKRSEKITKGLNNINKLNTIECITNEVLSEFEIQFPDVDISKSFDQFKDYLLSSGKTYKNYIAAFRNQCRADWAPKNKNNTHPVNFQKAPTGLWKAWCSKCGNTLFLTNEPKYNWSSECCGTDLLTKPKGVTE